MRKIFKVEGLDCANCAAQLEEAIKKVEGVDDATVNFITQKMIVESNCEDEEELFKKLKKATKRQEPDAKIKEIDSVKSFMEKQG